MLINRFRDLTRNERTLFSATFFEGLGVETAYFVGITGYAAYNLKATPTLLATIMLFANASNVLGNAATGLAVDKFGPKRVLTFAEAGTVLASLLAGFVGNSVAAFIALASVLNFLLSMSRTASNAFAPYLEEGREGLRRINALILFGSYTSAVVGPFIGGIIVRSHPTMTVFLFCAAAVFISLVLLQFTHEEYTPEKTGPRKGPLAEALEGARIVFAHQSMRYYLIVGITLWFSFGAYDALESLYYKHVVHASIAWMGYINAAIGIGMVVGVLILANLPGRFVRSVLLAVLVGCEGIGSLIYVGTHTIAFVVLGGFLLGVAFGVAEPMMRTLIQADAPLESVGRVLGTIQVFRVGVTLIPLALAPALARLLGIQGTLVAASFLTVVLACFLVPLGRSVDRRKDATRVMYPIDPLAEGDESSPHERAAAVHE